MNLKLIYSGIIICLIGSICFAFSDKHDYDYDYKAEWFESEIVNYNDKTVPNDPPVIRFSLAFRNNLKSTVLLICSESNLELVSEGKIKMNNLGFRPKLSLVFPGKRDTIEVYKTLHNIKKGLEGNWQEGVLRYKMTDRCQCINEFEKTFSKQIINEVNKHNLLLLNEIEIEKNRNYTFTID